VPFTVNLGVAYTVPRFLPRLLDITVMMDYKDLFRIFTPNDILKRNPALGLSVGAEVTLISMFKFRAGLSDWLPAVGFGVAFGAFNMDLAYYGKQTGNEPSLSNSGATVLELAFTIKPKGKEKVAPWARQGIVNKFLGAKKAKDEAKAAATADSAPAAE
jgi:hypothetical protein